MNNARLKQKHVIIPLAVLCTLLWGSAFPVLKITYGELHITTDDVASRMVLAGIRFFLSSMILFILSQIINKKVVIPESGKIKSLIILGILSTTLQYYFFYNGLANTSGIKSAILASSGTFFVIIASHFIYHNDKINISKILGLLLGFIGIFMVNWKSGSQQLLLDFYFKGEGFLILSGLSSAAATFYAKKLSQKISPITINSWQFLFGSVVLIITGLIIGKGFHIDFNLLSIILLIYSSILSATAFTIWFYLLKYNTPSKITIFKFLIPVFGSTLSAILLQGESFTIMIVISLICASSGIYLVQKNA